MIRIVTDSAADLTAEELSVPGIFVVPLSVTFADGTTQLDDGTMTKDEFFVRLAEDSKLPRTSQPSPASFMQVYEDAAAAGDEVLVITIGQKLSGTYQCAHLAAADVGLQVHLVDKGRGRPGALVAMFKQLDALGGIDPRYGYTLLYSDNKQLIAPVHHYMHQNLQLTGGRVAQLGPTIGTHVGPGVVGVVFVAKE